MPKMITDRDARYALDIVKTICTRVGPGLPGTPQERSRAAIIQAELESHLGVENVAVEEFTLAPGSLLVLERANAILMLAAVLLNTVAGAMPGPSTAAAAAPALVFSILPILLFTFQFIRAGEVIDPLLEQKTSLNVIGRLRKPGVQSVKRLLILGGHHDSAWEDTWLHCLGYGFYFVSAIFFLAMLVMPVLSAIQLAGVVLGRPAIAGMGRLGWAPIAFLMLPAILFGLFWHRAVKSGGIVPGAVDNLAACALTVAMCRFLVENPADIPEDTEIRFISFGSEEAGLRGSRRYVARHLAELKRLDTRLLNVEMVAHPEIAIMTSDKNGIVKNDPAVVKSAVAAAERAGVPYQVRPASLGTATDAAPFSEAGLKATTLIPFQFPAQFVGFYHQRRDGPERLSVEPALNVLKLTLEWIRDCAG